MMHEGYQMKLRSSFYLAHYLICRGGEFGSLIFNPQLGFNSTLHDASLLMHPKPCQASKFPVVLVWRLSFRDPNLLRAIHDMNNILGHPNRPVTSICSPPHDMSHHLAILLLFKYVVVALLLVLVGGLGVHVWSLQVWVVTVGAALRALLRLSSICHHLNLKAWEWSSQQSH